MEDIVSSYLAAKWQAIHLPCPSKIADRMFADLRHRHAERGRHYHNFEHLAAMFRHFDEHHTSLQHPENVALAIFFHDAVYKPTRKDNEESSADLARKSLSAIGLPAEQIATVASFTLATKSHAWHPGDPPDLAWLLDFDLSILGTDWSTYLRYSQQIRREYRIYPNLLYRPGRRKALTHFLERPEIFHTTYFRQQFEQQARENLTREIKMLG